MQTIHRQSTDNIQTIYRQSTEIIQKIYRKSKENLHTIYRHATAIHRLQRTYTKPTAKQVTSLRTIAGFEKISCIFTGGVVTSYIIYEMERHEFLLWKRGRPSSAKPAYLFFCGWTDGFEKHCAFLQGMRVASCGRGRWLVYKMRWW